MARFLTHDLIVHLIFFQALLIFIGLGNARALRRARPERPTRRDCFLRTDPRPDVLAPIPDALAPGLAPAR